jgi:hypothetical protein
MDRENNAVAEAIDGATQDWSVSSDAMRWMPDHTEDERERASVAALIELHRAAAVGRAVPPPRPSTAGLPAAGLTATPEPFGAMAAEVVRELTAPSRLALPPGEDPTV